MEKPFRKCPDLDSVQTTFPLFFVVWNAENYSPVNLYYKTPHLHFTYNYENTCQILHMMFRKTTIMTVTGLHPNKGHGAPWCIWQQFLSRLLAQLPSWTAVSSGGANGCISEGDTDTLPVKLQSFGGLGLWQASPACSMTAHFPSRLPLLSGFLNTV